MDEEIEENEEAAGGRTYAVLPATTEKTATVPEVVTSFIVCVDPDVTAAPKFSPMTSCAVPCATSGTAVMPVSGGVAVDEVMQKSLAATVLHTAAAAV